MADSLRLLEDGFRQGVGDLLDGLPELDRLFAVLPGQEARSYGYDAARRALAPLVWRALAGDVLTTEEVRRLLGVSRQALHKRLAGGSLLGLGAERTTLFPVWQFSGAAVHPAVAKIVKAFREHMGAEADARLIVSWAVTPQPELKEETPADWLLAGGDEEPLLRAAARAAKAIGR